MAGTLNQAASAAGAQPVTPGLSQAAAAAGAPGPQQQPQPQAQPQPQPQPQAQAQAQPQQPAGPAPDVAAGPGGMEPESEEATPEEQAEYERAMQALSKVLYTNQKVANSVVDQILPDDKVDSTAKVSMLFIKNLDEKVNMDEIVVPQMTHETVTRIIELAEARHDIEYTPQEAQAILGATWEGVLTMFGMDEQAAQELMGSVGADSLPALKEQYEAALNG